MNLKYRSTSEDAPVQLACSWLQQSRVEQSRADWNRRAYNRWERRRGERSCFCVMCCDLDCVLQVICWQIDMELLPQGRALHVRTRKTLCFSGKRGGSLRRKVHSLAQRFRALVLCRRTLRDLHAQGRWGFQVTLSLLCCHWALVLCISVCADGSGMAGSRLLEGYLFFTSVLRFWLCLASH